MSHQPPPPPVPAADPGPPTGPIWRLPGVLALVVLSVLGFGGFSTLVSVVPLWVVRGGASEAGAGSVTTVLLVVTVITQTFVPRLLERFGHAAVLSAGLVTLGVPSLGFVFSSDLLPVLLLSAIRGIGFGILTVTGSAVVADLAPPARRGEAIGAYGLGVAVPNLIFLPVSVIVAEQAGFGWAFGAGAMPLLGLPAAVALGRVLRGQAVTADRPDQASSEQDGATLRRALLRLAVPAGVLMAVTLSGGALMTFLPQITAAGSLARAGVWASVALFVLGGTSAFTRWWIGGVADRRGAGRLMIPLLVVGAGGMGLIALAGWTEQVPWLLVGVALVGCAYGALQNLTLLAAFQQVDRSRYGTASAVWNIGFDSGTALGSMLLGVVASQASFTTGIIALGCLMVLALPLALRLGQESRSDRSSR